MANLDSLFLYLLIILITTTLCYFFEKTANKRLQILLCVAIICIPSIFASF